MFEIFFSLLEDLQEVLQMQQSSNKDSFFSKFFNFFFFYDNNNNVDDFVENKDNAVLTILESEDNSDLFYLYILENERFVQYMVNLNMYKAQLNGDKGLIVLQIGGEATPSAGGSGSPGFGGSNGSIDPSKNPRKFDYNKWLEQNKNIVKINQELRMRANESSAAMTECRKLGLDPFADSGELDASGRPLNNCQMIDNLYAGPKAVQQNVNWLFGIVKSRYVAPVTHKLPIHLNKSYFYNFDHRFGNIFNDALWSSHYVDKTRTRLRKIPESYIMEIPSDPPILTTSSTSSTDHLEFRVLPGERLFPGDRRQPRDRTAALIALDEEVEEAQAQAAEIHEDEGPVGEIHDVNEGPVLALSSEEDEASVGVVHDVNEGPVLALASSSEEDDAPIEEIRDVNDKSVARVHNFFNETFFAFSSLFQNPLFVDRREEIVNHQLSNDFVTADKSAENTVTADKSAENTVTEDKLAKNTVTEVEVSATKTKRYYSIEEAISSIGNSVDVNELILTDVPTLVDVSVVPVVVKLPIHLNPYYFSNYDSRFGNIFNDYRYGVLNTESLVKKHMCTTTPNHVVYFKDFSLFNDFSPVNKLVSFQDGPVSFEFLKFAYSYNNEVIICKMSRIDYPHAPATYFKMSPLSPILSHYRNNPGAVTALKSWNLDISLLFDHLWSLDPTFVIKPLENDILVLQSDIENLDSLMLDYQRTISEFETFKKENSQKWTEDLAVEQFNLLADWQNTQDEKTIKVQVLSNYKKLLARHTKGPDNDFWWNNFVYSLSREGLAFYDDEVNDSIIISFADNLEAHHKKPGRGFDFRVRNNIEIFYNTFCHNVSQDFVDGTLIYLKYERNIDLSEDPLFKVIYESRFKRELKVA